MLEASFEDVSGPPPETFRKKEEKVSGLRALGEGRVVIRPGRQAGVLMHEEENHMSGVHPGIIIGGAAVGTGVVANKSAAALLPFTGIALGVYVVLAVGLLVAGLALRLIAGKKA